MLHRAGMLSLSLPVKCDNSVSHVSLLDVRQFGENGQCENLLCGLFRGGEIAPAMAQKGVAFLKVERNRIVDLGSDALVLKEFPESVSLWSPDDILVVNVSIRVLSDGKLEAIDG